MVEFVRDGIEIPGKQCQRVRVHRIGGEEGNAIEQVMGLQGDIGISFQLRLCLPESVDKLVYCRKPEFRIGKQRRVRVIVDQLFRFCQGRFGFRPFRPWQRPFDRFQSLYRCGSALLERGVIVIGNLLQDGVQLFPFFFLREKRVLFSV